MGLFLILFGFLVSIIGIISLIKPLKFLRITTRKMGAVVLVAGFVIFLSGGVLIPPVEEDTVAFPEEQGEEVAVEESESEIKPEPESKPEPEQEPEEVVEFISVGETTSFAEWDYKVIEIEMHKAIRDERARGQYIVFMVEVTNNAKMDREVGRLFQLEDQEGRVFSFDSSASLSHHHAYRTDAWHYEDIGPSFTAVLPIVFDVPEDVEIIFLYPKDLKEKDLTETKIIKFELNSL